MAARGRFDCDAVRSVFQKMAQLPNKLRAATVNMPPHFHVKYGEHKAVVDIRHLRLTDDQLPRHAANLVLDWAELHRQELLENWDLCQSLQNPKPTAPLE